MIESGFDVERNQTELSITNFDAQNKCASGQFARAMSWQISDLSAAVRPQNEFLSARGRRRQKHMQVRQRTETFRKVHITSYIRSASISL